MNYFRIFFIYFLILSSLLVTYFYFIAFHILHAFCVTIVLAFISWFLSIILYNWTSFSTVSAKDRAVLITGCDTGFGNQLAIECDKLGFHVFAGVLHPDKNGAQDLQTVCSERLKVMRMDVTKYEEVVNVVNHIQSSGLQLWAVVNNAGITINTPIEWGYDVKQINQIFAINVFGAVRVAKLSLPLLRQSHGRIINMSSLMGRITLSNETFYAMSKHAIKAFSDGLRRQLRQFNIKVVVIEPTAYRTPITDMELKNKIIDQIWSETSPEIQSVYVKTERKGIDYKFMRNSKEVVNTLVDAITLAEPQLYYRCGGLIDYVIVWPFTYVSEIIQDFVMNIVFGLANIRILMRFIEFVERIAN